MRRSMAADALAVQAACVRRRSEIELIAALDHYDRHRDNAIALEEETLP